MLFRSIVRQPLSFAAQGPPLRELRRPHPTATHKNSKMLLVVGALAAAAAAVAGGAAAAGHGVSVRVCVTNNAPSGGVYLTPVFVAANDGTFDVHSPGDAVTSGLEQVAEVGQTGELAAEFAASSASGVSGQVGMAPIAPGHTANVTLHGVHARHCYLAFASMVLPSSDYFVGNAEPRAVDIAPVVLHGDTLRYAVYTVYDAGSEQNDFAFSAGNGLFDAAVGLPASDAALGADEGGVVSRVRLPFAGFASAPPTLDTNPAADFNFVDYARGVATIVVERVATAADDASADASAEWSRSSDDSSDDDDDSSSGDDR